MPISVSYVFQDCRLCFNWGGDISTVATVKRLHSHTDCNLRARPIEVQHVLGERPGVLQCVPSDSPGELQQFFGANHVVLQCIPGAKLGVLQCVLVLNLMHYNGLMVLRLLYFNETMVSSLVCYKYFLYTWNVESRCINLYISIKILFIVNIVNIACIK